MASTAYQLTRMACLKVLETNLVPDIVVRVVVRLLIARRVAKVSAAEPMLLYCNRLLLILHRIHSSARETRLRSISLSTRSLQGSITATGIAGLHSCHAGDAVRCVVQHLPLQAARCTNSDTLTQLPAEYYHLVLGKQFKQNCCLFPDAELTLNDAEDSMLGIAS